MHGMGFCCCPAGCDYFTDDFTRANSTDLGDDWTEDVGDWSIASNQLTVSSADAQVTCGTEHPTSGTAYRLTVLLEGGEEGDELGAWINNDPTTRAVIVFHTAGATGRARLRLFVADVLVGETDINAPPGSQQYLYLCTDGDHVAVGVGGTLYLSESVTITSSVCGLLTGALDGGTAAKFDNFKLSKDQSDDSACPACGESCTYFTPGLDGDPFAQSPALIDDPVDVVSGDWTRGFYTLITSSANALILFDIDNPSGVSHRIAATLAGGPGEAKARIIADYVDSANYLFVEMHQHFSGGSTLHTLAFYRRSSGTDTFIGSHTHVNVGAVGWGFPVELRVGDSVASAWDVGYSRCIGQINHSPTVSKTGIASGPTVSGSIWITGVRLSKHSDTDPACATPTCPGGLTCSHCSGTTPTALDLTFAGVASDGTCDFSDPGGCVLWNDTFRLTQDATDPCLYTYTAGGSPGACSPHHITARFKEVGSAVKALEVYAYADAGETKWLWFLKEWTSDPVACSSLSGESIPYQGQTVCAGTPTCSVTAVA